MYKKIIIFWAEYLKLCFSSSEATITTEPWDAHRGYLLSLFIKTKKGIRVEARFNNNRTISILDIDDKILEELENFESIDTWLKENIDFTKLAS